jgi:N-acetylglucosaminyldiphosphoundecaprenol N-acetyl-beta-D-mannosaminyltransferase
MDLKEVRIWNIKYNLLMVKEIVDIVNEWLDQGRMGIHLTGVDASVAVLAQDDELLRKAILSSDIVNVDSYLPTRMLAKKGYDIKNRVTTPDLMEGLLRRANEKKQKVFLLGAKEETLTILIDILKTDYPKMNLIGWQNGYFSEKEEASIAERISQLAPDYLFIALPSPRKETFILKYKGKINVGVFLGVGGAFDARANVLKRPPKFLQGHGLEAFFRIIRNPRSYGNRIHKLIAFYLMARKL